MEYQRVLLVDGAHFDRIRDALGTNIDFGKLLNELSSKGPLSRVIFYRDLRNSEEIKRRGRLLDWLRTNGVEVKGAVASDRPSKERYGANLVALAVDAMSLCNPGDQLYLIAGDEKLVPLVSALCARDVLVVLISTMDKPVVAPTLNLIENCHHFVDLHDRLESVAR